MNLLVSLNEIQRIYWSLQNQVILARAKKRVNKEKTNTNGLQNIGCRLCLHRHSGSESRSTRNSSSTGWISSTRWSWCTRRIWINVNVRRETAPDPHTPDPHTPATKTTKTTKTTRTTKKATTPAPRSPAPRSPPQQKDSSIKSKRLYKRACRVFCNRYGKRHGWIGNITLPHLLGR